MDFFLLKVIVFIKSHQAFHWKWISIIWGLVCQAFIFYFQFSYSVQEETHSGVVMPHWAEPNLDIIYFLWDESSLIWKELLKLKSQKTTNPRHGYFYQWCILPKGRSLKFQFYIYEYIYTHIHMFTHICMCAYKYLQSFMYINIVFQKEDRW